MNETPIARGIGTAVGEALAQQSTEFEVRAAVLVARIAALEARLASLEALLGLPNALDASTQATLPADGAPAALQ